MKRMLVFLVCALAGGVYVLGNGGCRATQAAEDALGRTADGGVQSGATVAGAVLAQIP